LKLGKICKIVHFTVRTVKALKRKLKRKRVKRRKRKRKKAQPIERTKYTLDHLVNKGWVVCWTAYPL